MTGLLSSMVLSGNIGSSGPKPRPKGELPWASRDCNPSRGAMVRPAVPEPRAVTKPRREMFFIGKASIVDSRKDSSDLDDRRKVALPRGRERANTSTTRQHHCEGREPGAGFTGPYEGSSGQNHTAVAREARMTVLLKPLLRGTFPTSGCQSNVQRDRLP